jgi:hypothetical protein
VVGFFVSDYVGIVESRTPTATSLLAIIPAALGEDIKKLSLKMCVVGEVVNGVSSEMS